MSTENDRRRDGLGGRLMVLVVLATCLRVWMGPVAITESARAQIPDSGLQRQQVLEETRRTNLLLTEIKQVLISHTFNVRVQGADNQADTPAKRRRGPR